MAFDCPLLLLITLILLTIVKCQHWSTCLVLGTFLFLLLRLLLSLHTRRVFEGPSVITAHFETTSSKEEEAFHPEVLNLIQEDNLTKQAVVEMVPSKPKPGTVMAGYNPKLDEKRPQIINEYLQCYRIMFVIDDSGSMSGPRWSEARDALFEIAQHALEFHSDAVEICFFNNSAKYEGVKGIGEVIRIFSSVSPSRGTPTGRVLGEILNKQIRQLDDAKARGMYSSEAPLDIIVLTDGCPDRDSPPAPVIDQAAEQMRAKKHHPNWIGIQFVQIDNDCAAEPTLLSLIDSPKHNMVDTISYGFYAAQGGGKLTAPVLERIILGGMHPTLRKDWNRYRQQEFQKASRVVY